MPLPNAGAECRVIEARALSPFGGLVSLLSERPARVTLLLAAICALGVYDLMHTLMYMKTIGMVELNPLARYMVETGGEQQLVLFKLFSLALSCGILYFLRRTRPAEICACAGFVVMVVLTVYWFVYNGHVVQLAEVWQNTNPSHDPRWVYVY
ncbi:MAG: DUF5658 family protein [Planctomycetota bacterium]|jgi:hypothetical protein